MPRAVVSQPTFCRKYIGVCFATALLRLQKGEFFLIWVIFHPWCCDRGWDGGAMLYGGNSWLRCLAVGLGRQDKCRHIDRWLGYACLGMAKRVNFSCFGDFFTLFLNDGFLVSCFTS